jgi:hypothetical protein
MGLGALALGGMLIPAKQAAAADGRTLTPPAPHFPAKAKHVIHLFMNGGPSHVDTFDPKPMLAKYAGQNLPIPNLATERKTGAAFSPRRSHSASTARAASRLATSSSAPPSRSTTSP